MPASVRPGANHRPGEPHAWGFIALAAIALARAALWNSYPILFANIGSYFRVALECRYVPDRPNCYSLFMLPFDPRVTLWPVAAVQSRAADWVIERATALLPVETLARHSLG